MSTTKKFNSVINLTHSWQRPSTVPFDMQVCFFDALTSRDIEKAGEILADDCLFLFPGIRPVKGKRSVKRTLSLIRRRFDDISWRSSIAGIGAGDWLLTAWTVEGVFRVSREQYSNEGVSLVRLDACGKIVVLSDYFKDTEAFRPRMETPIPSFIKEAER